MQCNDAIAAIIVPAFFLLNNLFNKNFAILKKIRIAYPRFYKFAGQKDYCKNNIVSLPELKKELAALIKLNCKKLLLENFPLCLINAPCAENFNWNLYLAINGKVVLGKDTRVFPKECKSCIYKNKICQGLHNSYSLYFPSDFVKPFK